MPNNRQLTLIIWTGGLLAFALFSHDVRSSIRDLLRIALSPAIVTPLIGMAAWVTGLVLLSSNAGLWTGDLATDTVLWFITAGIVLFGSFTKASNTPQFFRRTALATLELTVAVEVFSELFVLNLVAELFLPVVLIPLTGMSVVAANQRGFEPVKRVTDVLLTLIGVGILVYVGVSLAHTWSAVDKDDILSEFALPVWLTVGLLPYVYFVGLYAAYDSAFRRIDRKSDSDRRARLKSKLILLINFHIRARDVGAFTGAWPVQLAAAGSLREARQVVREFRASQRSAADAAAESESRLVQYAGSDSVDDQGRRLDRREFRETTNALRWLATCQMGWYRRRGGRYRADLLQVLNDDFTRRGLPQPSGITLSISPRGDAWFAWRRTVTGWVFAIGAAGPPPDQWEYDGAEPPTGFPGQDPVWGTRPFSDNVNRNW